MAKTKDKPARPGVATSAAPSAKTKADMTRLVLIASITIIVIVELFIIFGLRQRYIISTYRTRAKAAYASQDYRTALKYYQGLLKIAPVSVPVNEETGDTYVGLGEHETAIRHYTTALSTDAKAKGINAKIGLAHVAQGQPERAVRLYAAAEALREAIRLPAAPADRCDYEAIPAARATLGEEAFAAAWAAGRAMSPEQATEYALASDG